MPATPDGTANICPSRTRSDRFVASVRSVGRAGVREAGGRARRIRRPIFRADSQEAALELLAQLGPGVVLADVENTVSADGATSGRQGRALRERASAMSQRQLGVMYVSNAELGCRADEIGAVAVVEQANKPFTSLSRLRGLAGQEIVAVWGDQPVTDGVLAWRLAIPYVRQRTPDAHPARRVARMLGVVVERLLFAPPHGSGVRGTVGPS